MASKNVTSEQLDAAFAEYITASERASDAYAAEREAHMRLRSLLAAWERNIRTDKTPFDAFRKGCTQ